MQYRRFFFFFLIAFLILKKYVQRRVTIPQGQQHVPPLIKVKPCSSRLVFGWVTKYEYPDCCNNFFSFFPLLFPRRTAELPSLCTVVSSIYQLFVPHFAMALFMCIYLNYRINKQQDTSFEYSSILSTVIFQNISWKHWITTWIIRKFIQLVNFVTFSVFFFIFCNRTWLNLYEWALWGNGLFSLKRLL